jgi:beta-aspartyl-peptidase (threonine type)
VAVHGGAGSLAADDPATSGGGPEAPRLEGVRRAARVAWEILQGGGSALDAVVAAVTALEDDPTFNAGTGSTLNADGVVEMDAAVMDGATLAAGAVAAVTDVRNPVVLARAVMDRSGHLLLAAGGASRFAREAGIPAWENERLVTPGQRARFETARRGDAAGHGPGPTREGAVLPSAGRPSGGGTVGAVARDARGHLAAATSTGGTFRKRPGRVGDTPIPGAGTYAEDGRAAVSATGQGERIIQVSLARMAAELAGRGLPAMEAAREAVRFLGARVGGEGGLVLVGPEGDPGFAHNTPVMSRAWFDAGGILHAEL